MEINSELSHQPPMRAKSVDDFQTPKEALFPLLNFLKKEWVIWECAEGKANLSEFLWKSGFNVIGSDKKNLMEIAKIAGIKNCRLIGKNLSPVFGDYVWAGDIR